MQHFRYNFAGFINNNRVANADILAADEVLIMQRCAADGAAGKFYRGQHRRRRQHARTPNLNDDVLQFCFCLFRRKFKGNSPTRVFAGCT